MSSRPAPLTALIRRTAGLTALAAEARKHESATAKVAALLPSDLAPHCRAVVDRGRQLVIYVDSPAWATRYRFLAPELGRRLATPERAPQIIIRILPERAVPEVPLQPAVRSRRGASDVRATAASLGDTPLARALARLAETLGRR